MSDVLPVISVSAYGAVGDGTTDDTAAIQSAITDAAAKGEALDFGNGTYLISRTLIAADNGVWFSSSGSARLVDAADAPLVSAVSLTSLSISGIVFDGDDAEFNDNFRELFVGYLSSGISISDSRFENFLGFGALFSDVNGVSVTGSSFDNLGNTTDVAQSQQGLVFTNDKAGWGFNNLVSGSDFQKIGLDALSATGQTFFSATNNTFSSLTSSTGWGKNEAAGAGIYLNQDDVAFLEGNSIDDDSGNGIDVAGSENVFVGDTTVTNSAHGGISMAAVQNGKMVGNTTLDNDTIDGDGFTGGLVIGDPLGYATSRHITVSGNLTGNTSGVYTQPSGIQIYADSAPIDVDISANTFVGALKADVVGLKQIVTPISETPSPTFSSPDPLFDVAYYLANNPDVAASGEDPYTQYMTVGWKEGRNPSPYFNTDYYLNQNPDVAAAGVNPLSHFESSGWKEGRDPSVTFSDSDYLAHNPDVAAAGVDPLLEYVEDGQSEGRTIYAATPHPTAPQDPLVNAAYVYAHNPEVAAEGLDPSVWYNTVGWQQGANPDAFFDTDYYLTQNPDVAAAGIDPLTHFEATGWKEGRQPSLLFDDAKYLAANPDVAAAGIDPLQHYLQNGQYEGRMAFLTGATTASPDPLVDTTFYDAQLGATLFPDGAAGQGQASVSYADVGWQQGLDPNAFFDTSVYLAQNPGVAAAGTDPLTQFEDGGWQTGVAPTSQDPLVDAAYVYAHNPDVAAEGLDASTWYNTVGWKEGANPNAFFDTDYYLKQNPDVAAAGVDPLTHFEVYGWKEGRQPSLLFDDGKYLAANPDVAAAGVDPLQHYLELGQFEGRAAFLTGPAAATPDPLVDATYYDAQLGATLIPAGVAGEAQATASYEGIGWQQGLNPNSEFDTNFYLQQYPDVAAAHVDPLLHYEAYGAHEGRNPSATFDTRAFETANPAVDFSNINPLLYYISFGTS